LVNGSTLKVIEEGYKLELLKRICASKLDVQNNMYLVDNIPFTGVAYFLEDDVYNGAYYIKEGVLHQKQHEAVLLQHKDKQWVPWKNIVSFFHEEVLNGTNYDLDEPYFGPFLYQDKPFTGIWVCFEEYFKGTKNAQTWLNIEVVENGETHTELRIKENGYISQCSSYNNTMRLGEGFISDGTAMGARKISFNEKNAANVYNGISIEYKEKQVSIISLTNDILAPGLKYCYAKGVIKHNYYDFNLENLEYRDKLSLSGNGITKQQLQFLFASSPALPKVLIIGELKTLNEEAFHYCKQELNMRCVDYYDTDY